jgi:hypothetical protein
MNVHCIREKAALEKGEVIGHPTMELGPAIGYISHPPRQLTRGSAIVPVRAKVDLTCLSQLYCKGKTELPFSKKF